MEVGIGPMKNTVIWQGSRVLKRRQAITLTGLSKILKLLKIVSIVEKRTLELCVLNVFIIFF